MFYKLNEYEMKQTILCLDMEWVLTGEIWQEVAKTTGIEALMLTTKDIADYDELMTHRLKHMAEHNLKIQDIQNVISTMDPAPGCVEFLDWARERMQVVILSDTFIEFARPLIKKMKMPTIFCHNLIIDEDGTITGYKLRTTDQKTKAVKRFNELNFQTIAAGDSFNDTGMLQEADFGFFYKPSPKTVEQFPHLEIADNYEELKAFISKAL